MAMGCTQRHQLRSTWRVGGLGTCRSRLYAVSLSDAIGLESVRGVKDEGVDVVVVVVMVVAVVRFVVSCFVVVVAVAVVDVAA